MKCTGFAREEKEERRGSRCQGFLDTISLIFSPITSLKAPDNLLIKEFLWTDLYGRCGEMFSRWKRGSKLFEQGLSLGGANPQPLAKLDLEVRTSWVRAPTYDIIKFG